MSRMGTFFNLMTVHKVKVKTSSNWEKICISTVFLLQTFHFFPNLKAIFMIYKYLRRGDYSLGGGATLVVQTIPHLPKSLMAQQFWLP